MIQGGRFRYGTGPDTETADRQLQVHKAARRASGAADDGGKFGRLVEVGPEDAEQRPNPAAAREDHVDQVELPQEYKPKHGDQYRDSEGLGSR